MNPGARSLFFLHLSILLWGFTGIFGKWISLDELSLVWYRMLIAGAGMALWISFRKTGIVLQRKELLHMTLIGFLVMVHWVLFYAAIKYSNVSVALGCFSSLALFTALLEPLLTKGKIRGDEIFFSLAAIAGIWMIASAQELYLTGVILAVISAFFSALFIVLNKKISDRYPPEIISFVEMAAGFLSLSALLPLTLLWKNQPLAVPGASDMLCLLLLSIACTIVPFILSLYALKNISAFTHNLSVLLEPVYSILLAILLFREDKMLNSGFYSGTLLILVSVLWHSYRKYVRSRQMTG